MDAVSMQEGSMSNRCLCSQDVDISEIKLEDMLDDEEEKLLILPLQACLETQEGKVSKTLGRERRSRDFLTRARFIERPSSVNMVINSTRSLLYDYRHMACSEKSVYCSKVHLPPTVVQCNICGRPFEGKSDRLLKLIQHFQLKHYQQAEQLVLSAIRKYSSLLEHMRKCFHRDQRRILACYN